ESERSSTIKVIGREFNPTLAPAIPKVFCMSSDGKTPYKVSIVYADGPKNNAAAYRFKVHIVPEVGKSYEVASTDGTVAQVNSYTYTFTFVADDYELTQGDVDIYIETEPGQTDLICESEHYKFSIQPQPDEPVVSVTYGQASTVACEGDEAFLSASSASSSADGDTWYYVYADREPAPSTSPLHILKSKNDVYDFTVKIPDGAPIGTGFFDADGNYHRKYYVIARDASQDGCESDATVYEMVIRPNNTALNIEQDDPRWSICEDDDPVTLLKYFYPGDGSFYIVGTDQDKLLPITKKFNGSTVFDPRIFTPDGIDYVKGGYDVNDHDPNSPSYVPAGFTPLIHQEANSVTYTIRYKQSWCPNSFYIDGKLTVNKKRDINEYGIHADDCYCTNDYITVEGYPNTILNQYGYAKLYCEGILEKDQPEDDGLDWRYTFSPVLRYRGNSNGKTIEFTYEYKDGATGCVYQVKKESKLYQPVADEIFFAINKTPDPKNFQGGFSEDYFCPDDDSEHQLVPYVYQYQFYDDGSPKLAYGSATNSSSFVTFTPSATLNPSEKPNINDIDDGYKTVNKWTQSFTVVSNGGFVTVQPVWAKNPTTLKLSGNTPDGLTVRVVAELNVVDKSTTATPLLEASITYAVTTLSYYEFNDGTLVSSNRVDDAVLKKYDAFEYKKAIDLTDYTDLTLGSYYYNFTGGPHIKVRLDGDTPDANGVMPEHPVGSGYDEKDIKYYYLDVSEIGNGNNANIHLYVDNGSECRNNTNDQCRANTERPVRVLRTLMHNMASSYCAFDTDEPIRVILNYPSPYIEDIQANRDAGFITGNLTSDVFNYDYEGVSGTSYVTVQKQIDSNGNVIGTTDANGNVTYTGALQKFTIAYAQSNAQPKIEYDDNGIGKVTFDFTDDGTRNVSFKWQHETGTTGAGRYHFVWTFVGDNPACEQTLEWDVFVVSNSDAFAIWQGKSWKDAAAGEHARYPVYYDEVDNSNSIYQEDNWWETVNVNNIPTKMIRSDRTPAIPLCWKQNFEDRDADPKNIISFRPTELIGDEVPGSFWIQKLRTDDGKADRPIPATEPVGTVKDDANAMFKVCKDNFNATQYISDYAIYTNTLEPGTYYRILYYVGCGEPFSRLIYISNNSSVTIAVDNEQNGSVCTSKTDVDAETGVTTSSYNDYIIVHAAGTAIQKGVFKLGTSVQSSDGKLSLLYDPTADSLRTVQAGGVWTNNSASVPQVLRGVAVTKDKIGQVAYLNISDYKKGLKTDDIFPLTIYFEYTAGASEGGCVYRVSKQINIVDFADVQFSVSSRNGDSNEPRLFCADDVDDYALATTHPKVNDTQFVPGVGWFEVTMQGSASGKSYGLYFVKNGDTDAVKVEDADITARKYNDEEGTFFFRPGVLSPGVYTINYIFLSDAKTYGGCYKTKFKQYYVSPSHKYQKDETIYYCPNYVSNGNELAPLPKGSVQPNWANNPYGGSANNRPYDVFTSHLEFTKQDLEQKDYGYYEFKLYHATNATISFPLNITTAKNDDGNGNMVYNDATIKLSVDNDSTNKVTETAIPSDGYVVKASLPITYNLSADGAHLYITTVNGNELYGRKSADELAAAKKGATKTLQAAVVSETCERVVAKFIPRVYPSVSMAFKVDKTCMNGGADDFSGKVTLTEIKRDTLTLSPAADGSFSYQWYFYPNKADATNSKDGDFGATDKNGTSITNPMAGTTFYYENAQKGYYILKIKDNTKDADGNAVGCYFRSEPQFVDANQPVDFVVDVREHYDCGYTGAQATNLGVASIKFVGATAPTDYTVVWRKGSGEKLPETSTIISGLAPGEYSAQVFPGSDVSACSNIVKFEVLTLPEITASSAETPVSCKGGYDGASVLDFTHLDDANAFINPAGSSNNYAQYADFDDDVRFLIADATDVVTATAAGWQKVGDFTAEKEYVIASIGLSAKARFTANETNISDVNAGGKLQKVQTDKLALSGLKAGNYTVWFKYGAYDECLYSYDFTITEPDDDIEIVRTSAEDISCNGAKDGAIEVTAMRGGKQTTNFGDLANNYVYKLEDAKGNAIAASAAAIYRFEGLPKGTYKLTVSDKILTTGQQVCSVSKEISIYEPGVVNFAQPVFDACSKTVRTNISGHWNQVAKAENPRNHSVKLEVSLWNADDKMVGDWTEVADGADQTFGVDIEALTAPKTYKAKWRTTWVNDGQFSVDGNPKEYYCDGEQTVDIQPYIA
ncbi:MAG: hypothetical protein U0K36_08465, partial [Bacteroidales bacterium]|nr:hypothetical protein [Bacteroidales bacterium]